MVGSRLSHFEISSKLGEGGMGEVWEARDTKLNRRVALKLLPEVFALDPQRMARFSREAQLLASLNHPNIAQIYGLEDLSAEGGPGSSASGTEGSGTGGVRPLDSGTAGKKFLVMELVEGEDLSERIARGPIPPGEAVSIALQIAEALEAAHAKGIIHRDLKPANIKLGRDGRVKVLDFGLAKALEGDPQTQANLTRSPTISMAATQAGIILGTAGYMSPEQARGQAVDKQADIWAFGVILYEMLAGQMAFRGNTISDVLASVLKIDLDWGKLPEELPPPIDRVIRRCLTGQPSKRLQDIGDARIELEEYQANPDAEVARREEPLAAPPAGVPKWQLISALAVVAAAFLALGWYLQPSIPKPLPVKVESQIRGNEPLFLNQGSAAIISPDGTKLAYVVGDPNEESRLFLRQMNNLGEQFLAGTEGGYNPFFSPDSQWLGFVTRNELRKVSVMGGTPLTLCPVERNRGAAWGEDGIIVFTPNPDSGLMKVPAAGGQPVALTELMEGEASHRWPQFLPGGRRVLFTTYTSADVNTAKIEVVDLDSGERTVVHEGGTFGRYSPSGHLLFVNNGTLFAAAFDLDPLRITQMPAPVLQNVSSSRAGGAHFDVSQDGTMLYLSGEPIEVEREIVRLDRSGRATPVSDTKKAYRWFRISPDQRRIAVEVFEDSQLDIWLHDLSRDTQTRLTFDPGPDVGPLFSHDGTYVYFGSRQDEKWGIFRKRTDGAGEAERLTEDVNLVIPYGVSSDGKFLTYHVNNAGTTDIFYLALDGSSKPVKLYDGGFREFDAVFTPDGKWVAYESDESGRTEIYIRAFPGPGGKWQVSTNGGQLPRFSSDGKRLVFCGLDYAVWEVSLSLKEASVEVGRPEKLFDKLGSVLEQEWEASADANSFYFIRNASLNQETSASHTINFTFHWFEELNDLLATAH